MSYYANTVLPTMEDVFADREPPTCPAEAGLVIELAGYPDVAKVVRNMSPENYETAVWDAHLKSIEVERPQAFAESNDELIWSIIDEDQESYEEKYNNK